MRHLPPPRCLRHAFTALLLCGTVASQVFAASARETPIVLAVRKAMPSVVNLSSEKQVVNRAAWSGSLSAQRVNGMGSGVIIDERGYIVTNAHVVDRVTRLRATLADGTVHDATTVGIDRKTDLAMVKIDVNRPLPVIPLGTSRDLMIAETVIAVGNAYGYENTVTRGVISALNRTVKLNEQLTYYDLIQTDASINPGNSGGPLVDDGGRVVGIVTSKTFDHQMEGVAFGLPIGEARERLSIEWH